jgi:type II secretory pathway pseudopilin PulG
MACSEPNAVARLRSESGFTLVDLLFVMGLIGILSTLAVPGLTRARGAAQASSAMANLRLINSAELSYAISCGLGFYSPDLPTLGIPPPASDAPFISLDLATGIQVNKSGFLFEVYGTPAAGAPMSCNGLPAGQGSPGYWAVADPLNPPVTVFFGTNASGLMYTHSATLAGVIPETGPSTVGTISQ